MFAQSRRTKTIIHLKVIKFIMKKNVLRTAVLCIMLFFSCTKADDVETLSTQNKKFSSLEMARLGLTDFSDYHLLHNQALDVFFEEIKNNQLFYFGNATPSEKELKAYSINTEYLRNEVSVAVDPKWIDNFFETAKDAEYGNHTDFLRVTNSLYYQDLMAIIDNNNDPLLVDSQINILIATLDNDIQVADWDKIALKSAMKIGNQSFSYWTLEESKWENLGQFSPYAKKPKDKKAIMKADVEGAVSGAIGGAITGAPFAGAGAGAGALLGAMMGAAWGSAVSGAFQHFGLWN